MIRVSTKDAAFNNAWVNANRALPVEPMEKPYQYGQRWHETYKCKIDPGSSWDDTYYIFERDEDYTWFIMRWA